MRRIFIDMDGVLAVFNKEASIEEVAKSGYFQKRQPMRSVIGAIKDIINEKDDVALYILSSVFQDDHSVFDKDIWLDKYLPEIPKERRLYVPYGMEKADFIAQKMNLKDSDILLDDFSNNLHVWHGVGIKVMNGINGTKGTWKGYRVHSDSPSEIIKNTIVGIAMVA